ncbi:MAG: hypothetical protein GX591_11200 [Planctomycetes bacterium]|nr:hypothetical protein [Planctomycetota bacterium]
MRRSAAAIIGHCSGQPRQVSSGGSSPFIDIPTGVPSATVMRLMGGTGRKVGRQIDVLYAEGCTITTRDRTTTSVETELDIRGTDNASLIDDDLNREKIAEAQRIAEQADAIIACVGGNEFTCREAALLHDCRGDRTDLNLLGMQDELVRRLLETGKPVVVILINGRPLTINAIAGSAAAIIEAWYLGQETGHALADVLFGDVNPAGRLPITFPRTVGQLPVYYSQKAAGAAKNYLFLDTTPLFPFGYGLSYTTFDYADLSLSAATLRAGATVTASVQVTNTGPRAGDEVVQLYVKDVEASLTRPVMELKGFARITLAPGESRRVSFELRPEDLSFTDEHHRRVTEPGAFEVMVGPSSAEHLETRFEFVHDGPYLISGGE